MSQTMTETDTQMNQDETDEGEQSNTHHTQADETVNEDDGNEGSKKVEKRKRNYKPKKKIMFSKSSPGRSIIFRPGKRTPHLAILNLPEKDPDLTKQVEFIKDKNGQMRKRIPKTSRANILAKRAMKSRYYRGVSTNQGISFPPDGTLMRALRNLFDFVDSEAEKRLSKEQIEVQKTIRISEAVIPRIRHSLNVWIGNLLATANVALQAQNKTIFKIGHFFTQLLAYSMNDGVPKLTRNVLNALDGLGKRISFDVDTVRVEDMDVPIQRIYVGASLEALLLKANIISKSSEIQTLINAIATMWLYFCANDCSFAIKRSLRGQTFDSETFSVFLRESVRAVVYG